jgi:CDP-diacylglycerol--glycerol-3-phosphate 3-phosphatidyltransferase
VNRPNYITLIRIALVPLTLVVLFSNWPYHDFITAGLVLFAWFTDFLDGVLARRTDSVSNLGIYLDAAADKIVVLCVVFGLAQLTLLPFWVPCTVLIRDLLISAFRSFASVEGVILSARWWGKLKTALTFPAIAGLIIQLPGAYPLMLVSTFVSVASGLLYLYDNRQLLVKAWSRGAASP